MILTHVLLGAARVVRRRRGVGIPLGHPPCSAGAASAVAFGRRFPGRIPNRLPPPLCVCMARSRHGLGCDARRMSITRIARQPHRETKLVEGLWAIEVGMAARAHLAELPPRATRRRFVSRRIGHGRRIRKLPQVVLHVVHDATPHRARHGVSLIVFLLPPLEGLKSKQGGRVRTGGAGDRRRVITTAAALALGGDPGFGFRGLDGAVREDHCAQ